MNLYPICVAAEVIASEPRLDLRFSAAYILVTDFWDDLDDEGDSEAAEAAEACLQYEAIAPAALG